MSLGLSVKAYVRYAGCVGFFFSFFFLLPCFYSAFWASFVLLFLGGDSFLYIGTQILALSFFLLFLHFLETETEMVFVTWQVPWHCGRIVHEHP